MVTSHELAGDTETIARLAQSYRFDGDDRSAICAQNADVGQFEWLLFHVAEFLLRPHWMLESRTPHRLGYYWNHYLPTWYSGVPFRQAPRRIFRPFHSSALDFRIPLLRRQPFQLSLKFFPITLYDRHPQMDQVSKGN